MKDKKNNKSKKSKKNVNNHRLVTNKDYDKKVEETKPSPVLQELQDHLEDDVKSLKDTTPDTSSYVIQDKTESKSGLNLEPGIFEEIEPIPTSSFWDKVKAWLTKK